MASSGVGSQELLPGAGIVCLPSWEPPLPHLLPVEENEYRKKYILVQARNQSSSWTARAGGALREGHRPRAPQDGAGPGCANGPRTPTPP